LKKYEGFPVDSKVEWILLKLLNRYRKKSNAKNVNLKPFYKSNEMIVVISEEAQNSYTRRNSLEIVFKIVKGKKEVSINPCFMVLLGRHEQQENLTYKCETFNLYHQRSSDPVYAWSSAFIFVFQNINVHLLPWWGWKMSRKFICEGDYKDSTRRRICFESYIQALREEREKWSNTDRMMCFLLSCSFPSSFLYITWDIPLYNTPSMSVILSHWKFCL